MNTKFGVKLWKDLIQVQGFETYTFSYMANTFLLDSKFYAKLLLFPSIIIS